MKTTVAVTEYSDLAVEAVAMYLRRQSRLENPDGRFDKAGRFFLSEVCGRECGIRTPSRRFPYSEMVHGRTLVHCAHALGVSRTEAMRLLLAIRARYQPGQDENLAALLAGSVDDELSERLARSMANGREPGTLREVAV